MTDFGAFKMAENAGFGHLRNFVKTGHFDKKLVSEDILLKSLKIAYFRRFRSQ